MSVQLSPDIFFGNGVLIVQKIIASMLLRSDCGLGIRLRLYTE
jgi:hypothetical protein